MSFYELMLFVGISVEESAVRELMDAHLGMTCVREGECGRAGEEWVKNPDWEPWFIDENRFMK